jgi:undecaprenyl diphosphate synthase
MPSRASAPAYPQTQEPPPPRARYAAIIADGNRRWACARGLPVSAGYQAGADVLKARLHDAIELGVEELTVYTFVA